MKALAQRAEQEGELDGPGKKAQAGESAEAGKFRHNQLRLPTPPRESNPAAAGPPEHKPVLVRRRSPAPSEASQDDQSASHEPASRERSPLARRHVSWDPSVDRDQERRGKQRWTKGKGKGRFALRARGRGKGSRRGHK